VPAIIRAALPPNPSTQHILHTTFKATDHYPAVRLVTHLLSRTPHGHNIHLPATEDTFEPEAVDVAIHTNQWQLFTQPQRTFQLHVPQGINNGLIINPPQLKGNILAVCISCQITLQSGNHQQLNAQVHQGKERTNKNKGHQTILCTKGRERMARAYSIRNCTKRPQYRHNAGA
jgi:hypothetical protein